MLTVKKCDLLYNPIMNKQDFIRVLSEKTKLTTSDCEAINAILKQHPIIGKKNKEKIIADIIEKLSKSNEEAEQLYETSAEILTSALRDKLKHPFKSLD